MFLNQSGRQNDDKELGCLMGRFSALRYPIFDNQHSRQPVSVGSALARACVGGT